MRKVFALVAIVVVLSFASVALAERGDIGGIGVTSVKPNEGSSIVPFEHCDIGGVGCATTK